ncbi:hypothetical protein BDV06DRAFT_219067 [Aspergillus oleicola]
MPSPLGANINTGVLFGLSGLDERSNDPEQRVVQVGAGLRWRDVYSYLDEYNVTVVGGRVLDVGVGGLILGGGLSYLSNLYGLVCDNVANFQLSSLPVVLWSTPTDHHMKTSFGPSKAERTTLVRVFNLSCFFFDNSRPLGIVTAFTLYTYPIHLVWGGVKTCSLENLPRLITAAYEFQQSDAAEEGYANFMLQAFMAGEMIGAVMNMVYLQPEPNPSAFAPFASIPTVIDLTRIQTLTEMMSGQGLPANHCWNWAATSSTPNITLYNALPGIITTSQGFRTLNSIPNGVLALGFQPISSRARHDAYVPYIFMNDASWDQDVFTSYGDDSVARLRGIRTEYW